MGALGDSAAPPAYSVLLTRQPRDTSLFRAALGCALARQITATSTTVFVDHDPCPTTGSILDNLLCQIHLSLSTLCSLDKDTVERPCILAIPQPIKLSTKHPDQDDVEAKGYTQFHIQKSTDRRCLHTFRPFLATTLELRSYQPKSKL